MNAKVLILLMMIVSIVFPLFPTTGFACSCVVPPPVEELVGGDTVIFSGTVKKIEEESKYNPIQSSADRLAVLIEVDRTWQGLEDSQVIVYTAISSASCGFNFQVNEQYLIYASENGDGYEVSLCSRTALLANAQEDVDILGEGQAPSVQQDLEAEMNSSNAYLNWLFAGMAGIVVIVGFIIVRRRK
ncbi:hypothetical protein [Bacillus solitudinis]|uniref:hypothetical protein n=1 Tax=Bacillus solitudinis TaxID=2014074 RepID=UPI000C2453F2|nr:hypothetical protein [Bacillus solitudinis]